MSVLRAHEIPPTGRDIGEDTKNALVKAFDEVIYFIEDLDHAKGAMDTAYTDILAPGLVYLCAYINLLLLLIDRRLHNTWWTANNVVILHPSQQVQNNFLKLLYEVGLLWVH